MLLILLMDFAILVELASEEADDTKEKALKHLTCVRETWEIAARMNA